MWTPELRWVRCVVARADHEMRLDRWLRQQFPSAPHSLLQAQLRKRRIRVLPAQAQVSTQVSPVPTAAKPGALLREGCTVAIDAHLFRQALQPAAEAAAAVAAAQATHKPLPLLTQLLARVAHADANFLVLDKPHGLAVQDGTGLESSLADYLPAIARATSAAGGSGARAGGDDDDAAAGAEPTCRLVHRLDKETSGLLVLARSRLAAAKFTALLQSGQVRKTYRALVAAPTAMQRRALETKLALLAGEIAAPVGGKPATTLATLAIGARPDPRGLWLELSPVTGRKHQLRVHCAQVLGAPIVGDRKYRGPRAERLFLHAHRVAFPDPFAREAERREGSGRRLDGTSRARSCVVVERSVDHVYERARDDLAPSGRL